MGIVCAGEYWGVHIERGVCVSVESRLSQILENRFFKDDLEKIRNSVPELRFDSIWSIGPLWEEYSETVCAAWLIVDGASIRDFRTWLNKD